jgi:hypothetical protein
VVEAPRILKMMLKKIHYFQSPFIRVHQRPTLVLLFQQTLKPGRMVAQASACDLLGQQP